MAKFEANDQKWVIEISITDVSKIKSSCDVDLFDPNSLSGLLADPGLMYEVVWHLVSDQAGQHGVDEMGFAKLFTANYGGATDAFVEALTDFFQAVRRPELSSVIEKTLSAFAKLQSSAVNRIHSSDATIDRIVQHAETQADQMIQTHLESIGIAKSGA